MTGAGMLACKRAGRNRRGFDQGRRALQIKGAKDVGKRAERAGQAVAARTARSELSCETDFVAKNAG